MSPTAPSPQTAHLPPRWEVPSPVFAIAPGVLLLFLGAWMVSDQGPLPLGWACVALGSAFLLTGAVAKGIAWGLEIHAGDHP